MQKFDSTGHLAAVAPDLERLLTRTALPEARFAVCEIKLETKWVAMRDGVRLATDLYLPPVTPAPVVVIRTPYGRSLDDSGLVAALLVLARRGYVAVSQDCRGTGDSEPDTWDYYIYEEEDSYDCIDWITRQPWYGGFIGSLGGSYVGQTQWCMATHPAMSATFPNVSGLGVALNTAHLHLSQDAYVRSVGKGEDKVAVPQFELERLMMPQTLAGGYFNEPLETAFSEALMGEFPQLRDLAPADAKRWLWERYCGLTCAQRAAFLRLARNVKEITALVVESLSSLFGPRISHDALSLPRSNPVDLSKSLHAPPLLRTGWYDWGLNDALATWDLLRHEATEEVKSRARLIITPYAHNVPGYHENVDTHPELMRQQTTLNLVGLALHWYASVQSGRTDSWPRVIYYLMGANEWHCGSDWPLPQAQPRHFYLGAGGTLTSSPPRASSPPDTYTFDPANPTPTVGGSIVSAVYPPGSVDVSGAQSREDVLVYTSDVFDRDLDVVGPLRMILYVSSSVADTDFVARLSDVFPDGRAIQLQSGILRTRYRNPDLEPQLLEPGHIYRLEIDLWATANRFRAGHRLRVDISSSDFPHFDRNSNRGGSPGAPIAALQTIYHDPTHPSHLLVTVLDPTKTPAGT
jgi:predicted acyl esterase